MSPRTCWRALNDKSGKAGRLQHRGPHLCLDTCDLLDIIQCVAQGKARRLEYVRRLLDVVDVRPESVQLSVFTVVNFRQFEQR
jgi:hypothetical protein